MKTLMVLFAALTMISSSAAADPWHDRDRHERYEHHEHRGNNWVAPLLGGLVVGAVISDLSREHRYDEHHYQPVQDVPYRTVTVRREHYSTYYYTPSYNCTGWDLQYDAYGRQEYVRTCYEQ